MTDRYIGFTSGYSLVLLVRERVHPSTGIFPARIAQGLWKMTANPLTPVTGIPCPFEPRVTDLGGKEMPSAQMKVGVGAAATGLTRPRAT